MFETYHPPQPKQAQIGARPPPPVATPRGRRRHLLHCSASALSSRGALPGPPQLTAVARPAHHALPPRDMSRAPTAFTASSPSNTFGGQGRRHHGEANGSGEGAAGAGVRPAAQLGFHHVARAERHRGGGRSGIVGWKYIL
jgi:hypothetical protein